ncbi:site-specific integrase [Aminobacter sp. NyZ550]|uniref:tyrosine-type recombinase/integrase n=1 Tax=Aminobacter sp. NyZ550 TaxID=2979870 RepID=UPI0021D58536|nr:site-specific integrase [Aminobacter sp. NyZ550]WAX93632.1 site-specific integrase [Aminobacter sp. NyZ550]
MPKLKLTDRFVASVSVEARTDYFDTQLVGLSLRVAPTGTKTWNLIYTRESDNARQRVKLGRYPAVSLEVARKKALKAMSAAADGEDPAQAKRSRRTAATIADLGELYIKIYAKPNKRTWEEDERILKSEVYPSIGRMKGVAVSRRDVLDIIDAKSAAGAKAQARSIHAVLRKFFNWAVDDGYLPTSPIAGVKARSKPTRRERVLSDDEVKLAWGSLASASVSPVTANILRLLFLTGQRSGEVCGMRKSEVDLSRGSWTIPSGRTKNELTHVVPLSSAALAIITDAVNAADDEDDAPLFTRTGEPVESNAIAQAVRLKLQVGKERWTPHDIRRTVATGMANIGIMPHIVEAVLNHISGFKAGVAGIYNRATYDTEKREALDRWGAHLASIIQ